MYNFHKFEKQVQQKKQAADVIVLNEKLIEKRKSKYL